MASSRNPLDAPDEPTERDGRALKAPEEKSSRRSRRLKAPSHHLVAEGTGSGPGLSLRQTADAAPRAYTPARHTIPSEVTAGRAIALTFSSSEEVTARGPALMSPPPEADARRYANALHEAAATASRTQRQAHTQDDTKDLAPSPRSNRSSPPPGSPPKTRHPTSAAHSDPRAPSASTPAGDDEAPANDEVAAALPDDDRDDATDDAAAPEAEAEVADDKVDSDFDNDQELPGAPPDSDDVAARALAVAALLQRALHEARPNNASEVRALQSWVDAFGLYASFGPGAFELFDAPHGAWTPEDRTAVLWTAEELRLLLWALGVEPALPSTFERSDAKALLKKVPLLEPPQAFLEKATLRNLDDIEVMRAFYEVLLEATTAEVWARSVLEDPAALEEDDDELELLLESAAESGHIDRAALEKSRGKAAAAAAGLHAWSRQLISSLFESGSPHAALAFDPGVFEAMSEQSLANAFAIIRSRAGALLWLTEGDEWDLDEESDEAGQDASDADASVEDEQ